MGVGYGRGRFILTGIQTQNPLTHQNISLLEGDRIIGQPTIPVTASQVTTFAQSLPQNRIMIRFLTPIQLKDANQGLLSVPQFDVMIARLIERCQSIETYYAPDPTPQESWRDLHLSIMQNAQTIQMDQCNTQWVNVRSGSRRTNTGKKISGFVGDVLYTGNLNPYLTWLIWGQSLQVGKNTVKGNGWYLLNC